MRLYCSQDIGIFFSSIIKTYPEEPTLMQKALYYNIFMLFIKIIPCESCQKHFVTLIKAYPPNMDSRDSWENGVKNTAQ